MCHILYSSAEWHHFRQNIWATTWQTNKMSVRLAKTQISLGPSSLISVFVCPQWVAKTPSFLHADSEDSDQTARMSRLIWVFDDQTGLMPRLIGVFVGCTAILFVLSCRGSFYLWRCIATFVFTRLLDQHSVNNWMVTICRNAHHLPHTNALGLVFQRNANSESVYFMPFQTASVYQCTIRMDKQNLNIGTNHEPERQLNKLGGKWDQFAATQDLNQKLCKKIELIKSNSLSVF